MRELGFTQNDFIVRVSDREAWIRFASEHGVQEQDIPAFLGIVDKLNVTARKNASASWTPFISTAAIWWPSLKTRPPERPNAMTS